jgi:hypothetical protein
LRRLSVNAKPTRSIRSTGSDPMLDLARGDYITISFLVMAGDAAVYVAFFKQAAWPARRVKF